ncbi:MAG: DUF697 domain-containing protein [Actinobacteria bacterium]|nr:DUF697 domain-containing protein [Actinomycetota bacterium]
MDLPIRFGAIRGLLKELEVSARDDRPLAVGGARELAAVLRRDLGRGARVGAIRGDDSPEGAALYLYVLGHDPDEADQAALKRARRARVPIVAIAAGPVSDDVTLPFVLATDVVRTGAGEGFPLEEIAARIAAKLGENAAPLAARVPLLRDAVCAELISSASRRNGITAAAVFLPGADLPLLTLNQLRLVLRIAQAYGEDVGKERLPELAASVGAGIGLRALARELLDLVPVAGWAVKGAVAYAGTRALGEAAVRRFSATV